MKKIKRIAPKSLAKVFGALYGIIGLIGGAFITLSVVASGHSDGLFGLGAVILLPILYGIVGLIFGYLFAVLYNVIAKKTGGIEFEVE